MADQGVYELPWMEHRGSACCLLLELPSEASGIAQKLLVGISHRKIHRGSRAWRDKHGLNITLRQYASNFYAFEPTPPFNIVAVSGGFCLPFSGSGASFEENHFKDLGRHEPFVFGSKMECPFITFVSGFVEAADPNQVIISYGINDCTSQFVVVNKRDIVRLLFHPFDFATSAMIQA